MYILISNSIDTGGFEHFKVNLVHLYGTVVRIHTYHCMYKNKVWREVIHVVTRWMTLSVEGGKDSFFVVFHTEGGEPRSSSQLYTRLPSISDVH